MKRLICLLLCIVCAVVMYGCSAADEKAEKWDCTVICMEGSRADSYAINYSDAEIVSKSGVLSFQNRNKFDIVVHLLTDGKEEQVLDIPAGGVTVLYRLEKDTVYTVGCHADVAEGAEITLMVYEGERADP